MSQIKESYINPFDDENASFYVLKNNKTQYSLWPVFHEVPLGWDVVFGSETRQACIEYVEQHWHSIHPFKNNP